MFLAIAIEAYSLLPSKDLFRTPTESNDLLFRNALITITQLHIQTLEAPLYNHSLICWPLSSSDGAVGIKGLAQGQVRGSNEVTFLTQVYPAGPND